MPFKGSTVLMVPPDSFQFNPETAESNSFQSEIHLANVGEKVLEEFASMVSSLEDHGIQVLILQQNKVLPDAVFPNNWFSTHIDEKGNNTLIIYPMLAENRQAEVNIDGLLKVLEYANLNVDRIIDLRNFDHLILEGTGSLVLDKENKLLYASLSPRTSPALVDKVAKLLKYKPIVFNSNDEHYHPIYHTNVILSITKNFAIICLEAINNSIQKSAVLHSFKLTNKVVIDLSYAQIRHMCGNVLELFNKRGESLLILSSQAKEYLDPEQVQLIEQHSKLLPVEIEVIETIGGGSARCMMAEIDFK